jgi:hypothetical protein
MTMQATSLDVGDIRRNRFLIIGIVKSIQLSCPIKYLSLNLSCEKASTHRDHLAYSEHSRGHSNYEEGTIYTFKKAKLCMRTGKIALKIRAILTNVE